MGVHGTKRGGIKIYRTLFVVLALGGLSCSDGPAPTDLLPSQGGTSAVSGPGAAATIVLTATPATVTVSGSSSVQATVTDSGGSNVADGTFVSFFLSNTLMGSITAQATTFNGVATATFTAATTPGSVIVTAVSGSVNQTVTITITAPTTGNIEFVSASPQTIGLKGGGQPATSLVTFSVKDVNGNPVSDGLAVSFSMNGPGGGRLPAAGGEYIGDIDATPTTASSSTVNGIATVTLNSGTVAGPVTIIASVTVGASTLSTSSSVISIGGGVPSATHINLSTSVFNLPGLVIANKQATITAYIADRFGNYNVLAGTSVSFYAEAGAIDTSNTTDTTGITTVTFRTQAPMPQDVAISSVSPPLDEVSAITSLNTTYGTAIATDGSDPHMRDGWVKILATVMGEEAFEDANGNGIYDTGETFTDLGEPFIDKDDDGVQDAASPFEEYIDANGSGAYDGPNGVWDGPNCPGAGCQNSKMIWMTITLAFTGHTFYCRSDVASGFSIGAGGSQTFRFMVGDGNINQVVAGSKIKVSASKGTLTGITDFTILDGVPTGPTQISFTLWDPDSDATTDPTTVTIDVTSNEIVGCTVVITGTVT